MLGTKMLRYGIGTVILSTTLVLSGSGVAGTVLDQMRDPEFVEAVKQPLERLDRFNEQCAGNEKSKDCVADFKDLAGTAEFLLTYTKLEFKAQYREFTALFYGGNQQVRKVFNAQSQTVKTVAQLNEAYDTLTKEAGIDVEALRNPLKAAEENNEFIAGCPGVSFTDVAIDLPTYFSSHGKPVSSFHLQKFINAENVRITDEDGTIKLEGFGGRTLTTAKVMLVIDALSKPEYRAALIAQNRVRSNEAACKFVVGRMQNLFRGSMVAKMEDHTWLIWAAHNLNELFASPELRLSVALSTKFEIMNSRDHDEFTSAFATGRFDRELVQPAFELKTAVQNVSRWALEQADLKSQDGYSKLSGNQITALQMKLQPLVAKVIHDRGFRADQASNLEDSCDLKLARIFGDDRATFSAVGHDRVVPGRTDVDRDHNFRFHTIASGHLYTDPKGANPTGPLFIPPGFKVLGPGRDRDNASYSVYYPRFGRHRNVVLNIAHLADADRLMHPDQYAVETNAQGSIRVGSIGGKGGRGLGEATHSHLQIFKAGKRLTFVDAFCK